MLPVLSFLGDEFVARQPLKAWINEPGSHLESHHRFQGHNLAVSIPNTGTTIASLLGSTRTRWIFTPSFNRYKPGAQQALLDRTSSALPVPRDDLDVGDR